MKRLAMSWGNGYVNRFSNEYLTQSHIDYLFRQSNVDFFTGIYSPSPSLCPRKYHREVIQCLPLCGPLIIDVDAHTQDEKKSAATTVKSAIGKLDSLGAHYVLFHSGRGFHIHVSSSLSVVDLPVVHKAVVSHLFPQSDLSIYDPSKTIRYENSVNSKSGTLKVPITVDDLDLPQDKLTPKLLSPAEIPQIHPSKQFDQLIFETYHDHVEKLKSLVKPIDRKSCTLSRIRNPEKLSFTTQQLLKSATIELGTRHKNTFLLAVELKHQGYPQEETRNALLSWGFHVLENGFSRSTIEEILVDTNSIVDYVFSAETYWNPRDYVKELKKRYRKNHSNRKSSLKWKNAPNELKVFCAMKAASEIHPRFFIAQSLIKKITGLTKLDNGKTYYIDNLILKGFIDRVHPINIPFYTPRQDGLPNTYCYEVLT